MSGHNKWSKIKHKKAASDAQKSKIFSKYANLIALESKKAGGDTTSPGLAAVIERAKKESMPKENIERAIARGSGTDGSSLSEILYETYGPGGVAVLISVVTTNANRTTPEIKHILAQHGCQLGGSGSALWAFSKTEEGYAAKIPTPLSTSDQEALAALIDELEAHDDVQEVFAAVAGT